MVEEGEFMARGMNASAAALTFRKLASFGLEMEIRPKGRGMNHVLIVDLPDGRHYRLKTARQCFDLYDTLQGEVG